jgi:hypothetical protein
MVCGAESSGVISLRVTSAMRSHRGLINQESTSYEFGKSGKNIVKQDYYQSSVPDKVRERGDVLQSNVLGIGENQQRNLFE